MKKYILLIVALIAASISASAGDTYYYSKATVAVDGSGKVYVSQNSTNSPRYGTGNSVTQKIKDDASAPKKHTYYLYAQPEEGQIFYGWYDNNNKVSDAASCERTIFTTSTKENSPTSLTFTARFGSVQPAVTVRSDWGVVSISNRTNRLGQKVSINTQQQFITDGQVNMAYVFEGWYDQDGNLFSTDAYKEFTIDREMTLNARWALRPGQIHGNGYYRIANMFNDYVQVVGDQDISFSMNGTSFSPDLLWYNHPRHFYHGFSGGANNNAFAEPGLIIYVEGTLNQSNAGKYTENGVVMTDIRMSAQGVVANDHMKGQAEGKEIKIVWSEVSENRYSILAAVGSTNLAFKCTWDDDSPRVMDNNKDVFDDMHFEAVDEDHIDTNWFAAFPQEDMWFDGGYWSTMYTSFPYRCYEEDGVEAYYISEVGDYGEETIAVLTRIDDGIVPPHTPVLLKSPTVIDMSRYFATPYHGFVPDPANRLVPLIPTDELENLATEIAATNCLRGTYQLETQTKTTFNSTMRVLSVADGTVGFYCLENGAELLGNRAYLQLSSEGARNIRIVREGEYSGIENVTVDSDVNPGSGDIYDLYGRRVEHPVPGNVYIRNGRKFICR